MGNNIGNYNIDNDRMNYGILYKYIACAHYKDDKIMYQGQKYIERIYSAHLHCHPIFRRKNPLFCGEINRLGLLFCWSRKAIELHGTEGGEVDLCLTGMKLLLLEEGTGKGIELESWGKREWNRALCKLPKVFNKLGGLELQRGFPSALVGKNLPANTGDEEERGSIPGWGRSPGGRHGNPLQYTRLESLMDRGAWWATVHSVTKSWTWLK